MDVDQAGDAQQQQQQQQGDEQQQQQQQEAAAAAEEEQQDPVARWSGQVLGVLQARCGPDNKPLSTEQVLLWMEQEKVGQVQAQRAAATRGCHWNTNLPTLHGWWICMFDCIVFFQTKVSRSQPCAVTHAVKHYQTHTYTGSPATWCVC